MLGTHLIELTQIFNGIRDGANTVNTKLRGHREIWKEGQ